MKTPESVTIVIHIHALSSRIFFLTNVLQFWQTWSCWNDLVSLSRPALLWISHTLWTWPQKQNTSRIQVKKGLGQQKLWLWWQEPILHYQPEKAFCFFELSTGAVGSNHSMALMGLFMSFNSVGQLYYGLANLLKVCASNLMFDRYNIRYQKIIYSVQGGLRVRTGVQAIDWNT